MSGKGKLDYSIGVGYHSCSRSIAFAGALSLETMRMPSRSLKPQTQSQYLPLLLSLTREQEKERVAVATRSPPPRRRRLAFSSLLVVSDVTCVRASTPLAWELVRQSTSPLCSSTSQLKSWSLLETPLATTRRAVSFLVILRWQSRTMKS